MLDTLARMLGLSRTAAEESLHSERAARHVLTRRDAFRLAGAMCAGVVLGEVPNPPLGIEAWLPEPTALQRAIIAELDASYMALGQQFGRIVFERDFTVAEIRRLSLLPAEADG